MPSIVKIILGLPIAHLIAGIITGILWFMITAWMGVCYILCSLLWPSVGLAAVVKKNACFMMAYIVVAGLSLVASVIGAIMYGIQGYAQTTHEGRTFMMNATKTKVPTHAELESQAKYYFAIVALLVLSLPIYGAIIYFFNRARKEIMQDLAQPTAPINPPINPPTNAPAKPINPPANALTNPPAEPLGPSSSTSTAKPITKSTSAAA